MEPVGAAEAQGSTQLFPKVPQDLSLSTGPYSPGNQRELLSSYMGTNVCGMNPYEWVLREVTPCPVSWVPEPWNLVLPDRGLSGTPLP